MRNKLIEIPKVFSSSASTPYMGNPIRYIPPGGALVEVTTNFYQGRYLGRPDKHGRLNETVLGVFGYAQRKYSVSVMALSMLSSHYHALCFVEDAKKLANFMRFVNGNLSKEIGLLHNWPGKMWTRRYRGILVSDEEDVQIARLKYVLAAGVKEFLVVADKTSRPRRRLAGRPQRQRPGQGRAADGVLV